MGSTIGEILPGVAGIDIGKDSNFVAVHGEHVRQFSTMTCGVKELAEYLSKCGVKRVCMESTGVYWVALYDHLDTAGFDVTLFNGTFARNVPGRKTDVQDCQWHAMLHSMGLLKKSFIPGDELRKLRGVVRDRGGLVQDKSSCLLQMQKALDLMNIRFHSVISQLEGKSGMAMVEAILKGERDPHKLLSLCHVSIREKKAQRILESLEGSWDEGHLFSLKLAYKHYQNIQQLISCCDSRIEKLLSQMTKEKDKCKSKVKSYSSHNTPRVPQLKDFLATLCGGAETISLPGIGPNQGLQLLAETGSDLSHWRTCKEFTSWATLAPGNHQSGKKRRRPPKRKCARVGQLLREAAMNVAGSKTALGAFYRRIKGRRGPAVALKATARKIAEAYYYLLTKGYDYVEQGEKKYQEQYLQNRLKMLKRHAKSMGFTLIDNATGEMVTA
jgi:transposase